MRCISLVLLSGSILCRLGGAVASAPPDERQPAPIAKGWEVEAKEQKLTEKDVKHLREHKFLVTDKPHKQVFSAYIGSDVPVFVTTDSILNGYHVLFEESIYRLEQANARKLPGVLEQVAKNLDRVAGAVKGDAELIQAAKKRGAIFIAVARSLLDDKALPDDPAARTTVQDEVKRIVAATGIRKPEWLGPPDAEFIALDYSRFKPRGFYTKSSALQRYFRAIAWLQAIPFRLEKDEELAAFLLMRRAYFDPDKETRPDRSLWEAFNAFLGDADDWDLPNAYNLPKEMTQEGLAKARWEYDNDTRRHGQRPINDQLRFAPAEPGGKRDFTFRFLSAYRLPDGVMFQRTMRPELGERKFPSGLEIAAVLGSPFPRDRLAKDTPKVLKEIDATRGLFNGKNLYADYLRCLGVLLERTEPDAPEFMRREPWRVKTCQTALAGWAQMRHTWALQAKFGVEYVSASREEAGFVEPVPEFYGRLAALIDATRDELERAGAFGVWDEKEVIKELAAEVEEALRLVKNARARKADLSSFTPEEQNLLSKFDPGLNRKLELPEKERESEKTLAELEDFFREWGKLLGADGARIDRDLAMLMGWNVRGLGSHWGRLSKLCHRLEVLAHKQLRQVIFSEEEKKFLRLYGKELAGIMFYSGNSYFDPRDDAMRVVDVFSNPNVGGHLLVGIARPRTMWVLYPTKSGEVLCRGAIVPYAEFVHPQRLNDADWKSLLNSPKRPEPPEWSRPVIPPERPREK